MKKDVMISLRLTPNQYVALLETLVKEKKSKSEFIRESINRSLFRINDKSFSVKMQPRIFFLVFPSAFLVCNLIGTMTVGVLCLL